MKNKNNEISKIFYEWGLGLKDYAKHQGQKIANNLDFRI